MAVTELEYPEASPSLNDLRKLHKQEYKRRRETCRWFFRSLTNHRHLGRIRLEFVRLGPGLLDYDNLVGGGKYMVDALVLAGIIKGDTKKIIPERHYDQVRVGKNDQQKTIIRIIDLD